MPNCTYKHTYCCSPLLPIRLATLLVLMTKKSTLMGPGVSGQLASWATRAVTNPSSVIYSPTIPGSIWAGTSAAPSQTELEADQTLQMEEESASVKQDRMVENSANHSPPRSPHALWSRCSMGVPLTDINKTMVQNSQGKEREQHLFHNIPHLKHADAYNETLSESWLIVITH